jgi:hypothetical protein
MTTRRDKAGLNRRPVRAVARWVGGRFDALIRAGEIGTVLRFPRDR